MEEPAPRMFWPREIWGQYGDGLAGFKEPENRRAAVRCLNHMVHPTLYCAVVQRSVVLCNVVSCGVIW
jgi:phytoene/squalene synthetase